MDEFRRLILDRYTIPIDHERCHFMISRYRTHGRTKHTIIMSPPGDHADFGSITVIVQRAGWPYLCLHSEQRFGTHVPDEGLHGAMVVPFALRNENHVVPLRPMQPGFAMNATLYAAVWWLVLGAPRELRRLVRLLRGRCIKCGYTLVNDERCPECGTLRHSKSTTETAPS